jgi:glutamate dehydrogenase/leucine dehydrogenase
MRANLHQEWLQGGCRRREHAEHARSDQAVPGCEVLYGPAKAANAGGVATSGLEMAQNSAR